MRRGRQSGYALLTVIFLAAVMAIAAGVAVPRVLTEGRREKEMETIWRGKQYARAVKLFYRKFGRFPHSLDELTKPVNNVRFMRQDYKDPFNHEDGSWRVIYVGPLGQLIGSVKAPAQGQNAPAIQLPGAAAGGAAAAPGAAAGGAQQPAQQGLQGNQPLFTSPAGGAAAGAAGGAAAQGAGGQVIGGNIIGVGSKVDKPSIIVYDGGATYREWEFIWNPAKDPLVVGGAAPGSPQPGTPAGQPSPGSNPPSTPPRQP